MAKKTWQEKLHNGHKPEVGIMNRRVGGVEAGGKMLIPTPMQVDEYIRTIPTGVARSREEMASELAKGAGADITCPMCTGIFLRIASEAAYEELAAGKATDEVTPFWRMIPPKAPIRQKLTFGTELIDRLRREEGLPV